MNNRVQQTSKMTVARLHQRAMEAYERAVGFESARDVPAAMNAYREALELETEAAKRLASRIDFEPTRAVIHRSAAAIALKCRDFRAAERLIGAALMGEPHDEIADELRELFDECNFQRHMELRGVHLASNEVQVSIAGNAVGDGIAETDEFVGRVQVVEKILIRSVERKLGRPFRETGKPARGIVDKYKSYISVPRAASFAVTLRLGLPNDQLWLNGFEDGSSVEVGETVRDLFECLEAYNSEQDDLLKTLIPDEAYHRNFVALARQLSPDGKRVNMVGFTIEDGERERRVALIRPKKKMEVTEEERPEGAYAIVGRLTFANSTTKNNLIRVLDRQGSQHRISVPMGMMADVVKPYWEEEVRVAVLRKGKTKLELQDIELAAGTAQDQPPRSETNS